MTTFGDTILSGNIAVTSALSSISPVILCKTHKFTAATAGSTTAQTLTGTFPIGTQNLDAKLFIIQAATSATASDKITVSAGGTNLLTFTGFGSAAGILRQTTVGLGTYTPIVSACAVVAGAASAELSYSVTYLPVSASKGTETQIQLFFNRADTTFN